MYILFLATRQQMKENIILLTYKKPVNKLYLIKAYINNDHYSCSLYCFVMYKKHIVVIHSHKKKNEQDNFFYNAAIHVRTNNNKN